jgi:formate dehydrogenase alpha subunit
VAGLATSFGSGAMSNSMDDVANEAKAMLIIGSNTTEQHPVFGTMIRQAVLRRHMKLVVADPRKIDITEFATLHLRHQPGTDIALINGLMHIILAKGWEDKNFIDERTEGFDEFKETVDKYTPEVTSEITRIPVEKLYEAAEILALNKPMAVLWAMGITQHIVGVRNVMDLANLQMLLGNMGVPGGGVNPLRGQNNVQGACDMGGLPNVYPAYQPVISADAQKKFETAWGVALSNKVGMTVTELIPGAGEGKVKALYIMGEDPIMSDPDSNHIRHCMEECDFVVLQEIFPSETSPYADVMLPGVTYAEKTGTFTNTERRIQMVRKAIEPVGESREDWWILSQVAKRILAEGDRKVEGGTHSGWDYSSTSEIMAEVAALAPSYAGVSHDRLEQGQRLQWPVKDAAHPGTPILHIGQFTRGKGKFMPIDHVAPAELPDDDYPMLLNTGRVLYHWHGGEMTRRAKGLMEIYGESLIEVNPEDALKLGINGNRRVRVTSRRGSIEAQAWVTDRVPPGMVFANFHFPEVPANELTIAALDPVAKIPEFKICAVKVELVTGKPDEHVGEFKGELMTG